MVGYVRRGDCGIVAENIADGLKRLAGAPTLEKPPPLPRFDNLYESSHTRSGAASPFQCFHVLFGFNCPVA